MNLRHIVTAFTLFIIAAPAMANSSDGSFAIKGIGARTCSDFVAKVKAKDVAQINGYVSWIAGYYSAVNEVTPATFDELGWQNINTVSLILMKFCTANPEARFATAVARYRAAYKSQKLPAQSPMVKIKSGEKILYIYQESLRLAQHELKQAGYNPGQIDGAYGEATAKALRKFQVKHKLPKTGLPDQPTLYLLMMKKK